MESGEFNINDSFNFNFKLFLSFKKFFIFMLIRNFVFLLLKWYVGEFCW